ncbi:alpha-amylase family glycosyl hydrolase [Bacillus thermotolerans]|mgnify:CR=1 FL=1|uniref:Periplasmic alpha-amylase n=1 Tax=Bacillus thermotolerans TaxID=1221996 RepID=A0A0F5I4E6_BACTR|nr:alpha-amylase family glycosyl hydrolase [Bacillus thermotolerans]KKB36780.1 Periplasmic alpha-amylase [Bacillus thermotolerans]KKB40406.1 Periplasmic alpha-amylase [Bacillus thermotolerans]
MKRLVYSLVLLSVFLTSVFPADAAEKEERSWQDETFYYVMTDRFHNGSRENDKEINNNDPLAYQGGDFAGMIDKLDYIKDMGFTSIIISPIFENAEGGYHGYWITDFFKTEPQFGTKEELNELVKQAHDRELKVLVDFPIAQISPSHPWTEEEGKADWFVSKAAKAEEEWLGETAVLNLENREVQEELIRAGEWWIDQVNIDGYYLSQASQAPLSFLQAFSEQVKSRYPDAFLVGEGSEGTDMDAYEESGLDAFMNMALSTSLRSQFKNVNEPSGKADALLTESPDSKQLMSANFLDTNKTARFTKEAVEENMFPGTRWMLGLTYLYTIPGVPVVTYGSEIALNGEEGVDSHGLLSFKEDDELISHIQDIGRLRQDLPALTRGTYEPIYNENGMVVFKREYQDETIIVAINNTDETQQVAIPAEELHRNKELRGLLAGGLVRPQEDQFTIITDRETSEIYALADKTGVNIPFITALAAVYVIFIAFLYIVWKRGRSARSD